MISNNLNIEADSIIPYFSWDRGWTVADIRKRINGADSIEILAWVMREAKFQDVWQFVSPSVVNVNFEKLNAKLGRKQAFWRYILDEWRKLGKI